MQLIKKDRIFMRLSAAFMWLTIIFLAVPSFAGKTGFGVNSYIIPADFCWQPNGDSATATSSEPNSLCETYGGAPPASTDDQSLFQLYGLLYALLDTGNKLDSSGQPSLCKNVDGTDPLQKTLLKFTKCKQIKVYWIIKPDKATPQETDLTLESTDAAVDSTGLVTIFNSKNLLKAGSSKNKVYYRGGPFVIDTNDLSSEDFDKIKKAFPSVKIHQTKVPFSGDVDKVLVGKPPKVAVLDEGKYFTILLDYIRAAGQFPWSGTVFQQVTPQDILNDCLKDPLPKTCTDANPAMTTPFQLIWAPHWEIDSTYPPKDNKGKLIQANIDKQKSLVGKIRKFLEDGNSGFFECASIASLESSKDMGIVNFGGDDGLYVDKATGGFLISNEVSQPRLQVNGGCASRGGCDTNYLKYEKPANWLMQCGGWNYSPTTGRVQDMRPHMDSGYTYLTTKKSDDATTTNYNDQNVGSDLTRFIHDDKSKLKTKYTIGTAPDDYYTFDYLVGGRINGVDTAGYVIYFPGHKYIECKNKSDITAPPARSLEFAFDSMPLNTVPISIEIVHEKCKQGLDCPIINFDLKTGKGSRASDAYIDVSSEFAAYDADTNKLEGVILTSTFSDTVTAGLKISDILVAFDDVTGTAMLKNIVDLTDINNRLTLCSPNKASAGVSLSCNGGFSYNSLTFNFTGDISSDLANKIVTLAATTSSGTTSVNFDLSALANNSGAIATGNGITLDARSAVYDALSKKITNVIINSGSCSNATLTDLSVKFPGSSVKLAQIYNSTTSSTMCSPNSVSPASCKAITTTLNIETMNTKLTFDTDYIINNVNSTDIEMTFTYTCTPGCNNGIVKNTYSTGTYPNVGQISSDDKGSDTGSVLKIDTSSAFFSDTKNLTDIKIIKLDSSKTVKLTNVTFIFANKNSKGDTVQTRTFYDNTGAVAIFSKNNKKTSASYDINKEVKGTKSTEVKAWSYLISGGTCSDTYLLGPYLSTCNVNWDTSNTCGVKYVLNTLLALKYQAISSRFSKTQPIVKDNILFKASYDYPINRGHLEMIKVPTDTQATSITIWDAANNVPIAGTTSFPSQPLSASNDPTKSPRYIFTNKPGTSEIINFDQDNAASLRVYMGLPEDDLTDKNATAKKTINTIRGRVNASATVPLGDDEQAKRLWSIINSTPALKTRSKYVESTATESIVSGRDRRDRFLFAGAADGMLHAFWAGEYCSLTDAVCQTGTVKQEYPDTDKGRGRLDSDSTRTYAGGMELWAYIPSSLLQVYDASKGFTVKLPPTADSDYESGVVVDGSPALSDFLVCKEKNLLGTTCTKWVWETKLVNTAAIRSTSRNTKLGTNHGIVFMLDVTNPYDPKLKWENKYDGLDYKGDATGDTVCGGTTSSTKKQKNCNMGESKGVAIGTAQIGDELKDYVFMTSNWIDKKLYSKTTNNACSTESSDCVPVRGVSAFALDVETGDVKWEKAIPYDSAAADLIDPPAVPALMDRDNNGSYDYVVFGDMQGRLWALRTTDGKNLTGDEPVHQVMVLDSNGKDTTTSAGYKEPIGASVAVYRDYVILGTGGSVTASNGEKDSQKYRIEVVKLGLTKAKKEDYQTVILNEYSKTTDAEIGAEQVWAKPAIMSDLKAYVGTVMNYSSSAVVSTVKSTGRLFIIDLKVKPDATNGIDNKTVIDLSQLKTGVNNEPPQGVVGGIDVDNQHVYIGTLNGSVIQLGGNNFKKSTNKSNPYKILWWRKM
jgi:hypothetical protein